MDSLPSYGKPPVNEVVCGVRFAPSDKLHIPHIGLLWERFGRTGYPSVQHVSPLATNTGQLLVDPATGAPTPRVWFINEADDELIQFQSDGYYFNWRQRGQAYPRYEHVIESFERVASTIESFFAEHKLGTIDATQYELTYVNHIIKGEGWDSTDDIPNVFSSMNWVQTEGRFLPRPESVSWQVVFPLPRDNGRLIASLNQRARANDQKPVLVFELKVLGIGSTPEEDSVRSWFDNAHEWIVRGFTDLTTPAMHELWERVDNG